MANQGKYTLSDGWIYVRGTEDQEDAPCIEASESEAVRKWAEREASEGYVIGDQDYYYDNEDDLYEAEKEIIAGVTDGDLDEMEADLDKEFDYLRTLGECAPECVTPPTAQF